MNLIRFILVATALVAASIPGYARENFVTRITPRNTPTVFYFHSFVLNCQGVADMHLAKKATVVVPEKPSHGVLSIAEGVAPVARCQGRPGFATIATYTPDREFIGVDDFRMNVLFELRGYMQVNSVKVHVQVGGAPHGRVQ